MATRRSNSLWFPILAAPALALVFLVAIPWLAVHSVYRFLRGQWLRFRFRRDPRTRGKRIVFVVNSRYISSTGCAAEINLLRDMANLAR